MAWVWWLVAAVVLGIIEITTLDLMFLLLAAGAATAAGAAALGAPIYLQVLIFVIASALFVGALRPWLLEHWRKRVDLSPTGVAALIGREAVVTANLVGSSGRIKLNGSIWSARVDQLGLVVPVGSRVIVQRIEGATAVVRPVSEDSHLGNPSHY